MKYLQLLLVFFSFNCFAKFQLDAINKSGKTYGPMFFDSQLEADNWASIRANKGSWGRHANWSHEEKPGYDNTREITPEEGEPYMEYHYPKEYSYTIKDISGEMQASKAAALGKLNGLKAKLKALGLSDEELEMIIK